MKAESDKKILFLCTHNSARSQMAEGQLRSMYGDRYDAYSAGTTATSVDPRAIKSWPRLGLIYQASDLKVLMNLKANISMLRLRFVIGQKHFAHHLSPGKVFRVTNR